jgi:hypothetical protein
MASVFPLDIIAPGAYGLNTERGQTLLDPRWATVALNAVVNRNGRLAARKGMLNQSTAIAGGATQISVLHEYLDASGAVVVISSAALEIYKDVDDYTDAGNLISSTTEQTNPYWQFINFNGKVLGFQRGEASIEWAGSSVFTNQSIDSTGQPGAFNEGNCALAAFGRVWMGDADLQTIRYSELLDDTGYATANGGGYIDMTSVWTNGMDEIVAIAALGATLIVFGKNHIVMWGDKAGTELGLSPTSLEVVDTIEGTGCIARDSIAVTGEGDLIFLSRHGVQSLGRVIQSKSNPTTTLSKNVRADMLTAISTSRLADVELDRVNAVHSPEEGMYIINFPTTDQQFVFDTQHPFSDEDGQPAFPVTNWTLGNAVGGMLSTTTGLLYFGTSVGTVGLYKGLDDATVAYDFEYKSGWLDFGDPQINHRLKIMKEIVASVVVGIGTLQWNWEFDFNGITNTRTQVYAGGTVAEFNICEFSDGGGAGVGYNDPSIGAGSGETEFSGSVVIQRKLLPAHGEGQFLRLGVTASINTNDMVLQHISISPKIGRMVT